MGNTCSDQFEQLKLIGKGPSGNKKDDTVFDFRYRGAKALDDSGIREQSGINNSYNNHLKSLTQDPFEDPYVDVEYSEQFKVGKMIEKESPQKGFYKAPEFERELNPPIEEESEEEDHRPKDETLVGEMNPLSKNAEITDEKSEPFTHAFDPDNEFNPKYGPYRNSEGDTYKGQYKWGKRWGVGRSINIRGELYEGQWDRGVKEGYARVIKENGDFYEGNFKNGDFHGHGKMIIFASGVITEGEFKNGMPEGYCTEDYNDGTLYEGMLVKGKKEGKGKFTFKDGSVYEGDFKNDQAEGHGNIYFNSNQ